jgi:hypothetical protein
MAYFHLMNADCVRHVDLALHILPCQLQTFSSPKNAVFWDVMSCGASIIIADADILHSHLRESLKSNIALTGWTLLRRRNVSPVR